MEGWKICWEGEGGKSGLSEGGVWWVGVWGGGGLDRDGERCGCGDLVE